jgi:O-6-methylguanine DNA methyltransferase
MKEQLKSAVLPLLPIVGTLKLTSKDGSSLYSIEVVESQKADSLDPFFQDCFEKLSKFLQGKTQDISIKLDHSSATPFQQEVLKAMKAIPFGKVATYKDLALKMNSRAYQAIGSACGKNPFLLIYPCHRVLGSNGLGGFAHGLEMKKALLNLEK